MRNGAWLMLALICSGCSKDECVDEEGCDTGEESYEPTGGVTVNVTWAASTQLSIEFLGAKRAYFGIVEPAGGGWKGEDCPEGPYCHALINPDDELGGIHNLVSIRSEGDEWDGTVENDETWMHRDGMQNQVWALFSWGGKCLKVGGTNSDLFDHYEEYGCPR